MGDQSRGAMPGERPPGNRKPGQNRGPRNGAGPSSSHSGGATSFTAKQKEDISTIRAFGIEEDKLTDEQIVSHMQSTKCRTEQLIEEFYTVASKQEKKAAQRKTKADRPERPERERRDDNRADRGEMDEWLTYFAERLDNEGIEELEEFLQSMEKNLKGKGDYKNSSIDDFDVEKSKQKKKKKYYA